MTNRGYVKSSPHFFRLIGRAAAALSATLLIAAALIPAPLQEQAEIARVPNPVKSAWFLLWIQEVVSYSKYLIYAVLLLGVAFFLLPWLPGRPTRHAGWLQRERLEVIALSLTTVLLMLILTAIGMFFRGENWALTLPF